MDKGQFDHIETFFRQAAMNFSPSVNEEGWKRMEVLLDREFYKKRRRAVIWWWWPVILFFLFLGGMFYYNDSRPVKNGAATDDISSLSSPVDRTGRYNKRNSLPQRNQQGVIPLTSEQRMLKRVKHQSEPSVTGKHTGQDAEESASTKNKETIAIRKRTLGKVKKNNMVVQNPSKVRFRYQVDNNGNPIKNNDSPHYMLTGKITLPKLVSDSGLWSSPLHSNNPFVNKALDDTLLLNLVTKVSNTSIQVKKIRRFYFIAAIAPDVSAVKKIHVNKIHSRYGLGAGYQLSKKISLQTGIYGGRMMYTAGDGDYTIKPGSYISKIIKINADCYFYNVPLSLRYNVLQLKRYNLYSVGGISSFWSRYETYDYHFLNRSGMYRSMVSTYKNNTSLFSAINLSFGFERSLSKVFYLQAEPYLIVPVSGVGEGKVKLHSAGLQFGIRYKPLRK